MPSSFLHNTQHISFLLFKSTHLGLIFKKRYACGVPYAAVFEIFSVKVDQVTMYYIGPGQLVVNNLKGLSAEILFV